VNNAELLTVRFPQFIAEFPSTISPDAPEFLPGLSLSHYMVSFERIEGGLCMLIGEIVSLGVCALPINRLHHVHFSPVRSGSSWSHRSI